MDAEKLLKERRSIREYRDKKVDKETLEKIIEIARYAPSGNNVQPWEIIAITDEEKLDKIKSLDDQRNYPACFGVFLKDGDHFLKDGSNLSTYIMLAAKSQGLGSCWINISEQESIDGIKNMLNIPENYKYVSLISIGYSDENPAVEKRSIDDLIHWEEF